MIPHAELPQLVDWARLNALALFPIPAWSKRPTGIVRSHALDWSRDPAQWRKWYADTGGCNFGVECGPSGKIVVDEDTGGAGLEGNHQEFLQFAAGEAGPTQFCGTPSGGRHLYYDAAGIDPATLRQPNIARFVNVRAGRGYVVAPWSQTLAGVDTDASNGRYTLDPSLPIARAFPRLIRHCTTLPSVVETAPPPAIPLGIDGWPENPALRAAALKRAALSLEPLRSAVPGERNNRLNEAAFGLGRLVAEGLLDTAAADEAVWTAASAAGISPTEPKARSTVRSGLRSAPARGHDEPRTAMDALLASPAPTRPPPTTKPKPALIHGPGNAPPEPILERLLAQSTVTVLSGGSGTGKTTIAASLAAASVADVSHFRVVPWGPDASDVGARPATWVFCAWEGAQFVPRNMLAWHRGTGLEEKCPGRIVHVPLRGSLIYTERREPRIRETQAAEIRAAVESALLIGEPVVVVMDNATAAVEDSIDNVQAKLFMDSARTIADRGPAVLIFAHPPKARNSTIYGAHAFFALADTVGLLEVIRRDDSSWVQWIDFEKHRESMNGECLELRSRRLDRPIVELPDTWGGDNQRARARQIRNLHLPYVYSIKVRPRSEKEAASRGVITEISEKPVANLRSGVWQPSDPPNLGLV